jgi:hypothetical protein
MAVSAGSPTGCPAALKTSSTGTLRTFASRWQRATLGRALRVNHALTVDGLVPRYAASFDWLSPKPANSICRRSQSANATSLTHGTATMPL